MTKQATAAHNGPYEPARGTNELVPHQRTRRIGIVDGYIPGIDYRNKGAVREGLVYRKAIIFDTLSYDNFEDVFFDGQLLLEICRCLIAECAPDQINITAADKKKYDSFEQYCTSLFAIDDPEDREPFRKLKLYRNGKPICVIKTEYFVGLPGPKPYEDSYTFSFYVDSPESLAWIERAIHKTSIHLGVTVHHHVKGDQTPTGYKFKRLFNWLFG